MMSIPACVAMLQLVVSVGGAGGSTSSTVSCAACSNSSGSPLWRAQLFVLTPVGFCRPPKYELRWVAQDLCINLTCSASTDGKTGSFCLLPPEPLAPCASMGDLAKLVHVGANIELLRVSDGKALDWGRWRAGGAEQLGFEAALPGARWKQWRNGSAARGPSIWTTQDTGGRCCLTVGAPSPPTPWRPGRTTNVETSRRNYKSKYTLLDPTTVAHSANGVRLTIGPVRKLGRPLISEGERPWEKPAVMETKSPTVGVRTLGYGNVYPSVYWNESSGRYTLFVNPLVSNAPVGSPPGKLLPGPGPEASGVLRFTSDRDGLEWHRADEGQVVWNGSTQNNLVLYPTGGVGVFTDPVAAAAAAAGAAGTGTAAASNSAVKMFGVYYVDETAVDVAATSRAGGRWSADGTHWPAAHAANAYANIHAGMDTHNNAFYDERTQRWVGITRTLERVGPGRVNVRCAGRTESQDFEDWSPAETILCGNCTTDDPRSPYSCQVYAMIVFPFYQGYLGLTMMFNGGYGSTMGQQWNDSQGLVETVDVELSWSRDTYNWTRLLPGTPLIPRTPWPHPTSANYTHGPYDSYIIFAPAYPVLDAGGVLQMFYGSSDGPHTACPGEHWDQGAHRFGPQATRRCRKGYVSKATLRADGFAGWQAPPADTPAAAGRLSTAPQICDGATLILSLDVHSSSGYVRAAVRPSSSSSGGGPGTPSNAWSLPIRQNLTDGAVVWPAVAVAVLEQLQGELVVVDFMFADATLYAFGFADDER
jgi:hypothetical protein